MKIRPLLVFFLLLSATLCAAQPLQAQRPPRPSLKGWDYLVHKLVDDGLDAETVYRIYMDPRMPPFGEVYFALRPRETKHMYSGFNTKAKLLKAKNFLDEHSRAFEVAETRYKVSRYVIASILLVETHLGKNLGKDLIINRLSRVAGIAEPKNLLRNYKKHRKESTKVTFDEVKARALFLEKTFYPEIKALIEVAKIKNIDVFDLRGSSAGAFGLPQFLPSSYLQFGVDANHDGLVSLFEEEDAIVSVGNFLAFYGWEKAKTYEAKKAVIWRYNHSDAYVETILNIAQALKKQDA